MGSKKYLDFIGNVNSLKDMNIKKIKQLIKKGEFLNVEFKEKFSKSVLETSCAFANTKGGYIFIGFDDRLTIWSPGFLPNDMTIEELFDPNHSSKPRNKQIAQIFYDLELVERYGSGIYRIINECKQNSNPQPEFKNFSGGFMVVFYKQPESQPELSLKDNIIALLQEQPLSKSDISKNMGRKSISGHLNKVIRKMLAEGVIAYTIPERPNSRLQKYKLNPDFALERG